MTNENYLFIFIAGAVGAIVHILVDCNTIALPHKVDGGLAMGFIGSMVVGGFVGAVVDGSVLGAGMGGYIGASILTKFIPAMSFDAISERRQT